MEHTAINCFEINNAIAFKNAVAHMDTWSNDCFLNYIQEYQVAHTRDRPDEHYTFVKSCIDKQLDHSIWNNDDLIRKWIYVLVEYQYPWFVCSAWNHLNPNAITFLHQASMMFMHFSNLYQLVRHKQIDHIWDTDFLMSSMLQSEFYHAMEHPSNKSCVRLIKTQLDYYPFSDEECVTTTLQALQSHKCKKALHLFLNHTLSDVFWHHTSLCKLMCSLHDAERFDIAYNINYSTIKPTIQQWQWFFKSVCNYEDGWMSNHLSKEDKHRAFHMCLHLLNVFERTMEDVQWCSLVLDMNTCFMNMFVRLPHCHVLIEKIWMHFVKSIDTQPQDDYVYTDSITSLYTTDFTYGMLSKKHTEQSLLVLYNEMFQNDQQWTFIANVIRWGTYEALKWVLSQCKNYDVLYEMECKTLSMNTRYDNPISLALYNKDSRVLKSIVDILEKNNRKHLTERWIAQDEGKSVMTAIVRLSLFYPQQAKLRCLRLFQQCPELVLHKNCMIHTLVNEWNNHFYVNHPEPPFVNPFDTFENDAILQFLLKLPTQVEIRHLCSLLQYCENENAFKRWIHQAFIEYNIIHPIDAYVEWVENPTMPTQYIYAYEQHPAVRQLLVSNVYQKNIVLKWLIRNHSDEFDTFLHRAKHQWRWTTEKMFPPDISKIFFEDTHNNIQYLQKKEWYTLLKYGLLPLCLYHPTHNNTYSFLHAMTKAFRVIRRRVQRQFKHLRANTNNQRKRIHFMIKCQPKTPIRQQKIHKTGIHYTKCFHV